MWNQNELDTIPNAPDWSPFLEGCVGPERLRFMLPCCGVLGGARYKGMIGISCQVSDAFDIDIRYKDYVADHFGLPNDSPALHFGPCDGNVLGYLLDNLHDADAVEAGPPCPPWAGGGA